MRHSRLAQRASQLCSDPCPGTNQASEEMTDNENWLCGLGVAGHLGGDRTAAWAVSAGEVNCWREYVYECSAHLGDRNTSSTAVVSVPQQPGETLLSPAQEEAGSLCREGLIAIVGARCYLISVTNPSVWERDRQGGSLQISFNCVICPCSVFILDHTQNLLNF